MSNLTMQMFTLFDTKVASFSTPFFAASPAAAIRTVQDAMRTPESMLGRHPADFVLYSVGEFNLVTADFRVSAPTNLGVLTTFLPPNDSEPELLRVMKGGVA